MVKKSKMNIDRDALMWAIRGALHGGTMGWMYDWNKRQDENKDKSNGDKTRNSTIKRILLGAMSGALTESALSYGIKEMTKKSSAKRRSSAYARGFLKIAQSVTGWNGFNQSAYSGDDGSVEYAMGREQALNDARGFFRGVKNIPLNYTRYFVGYPAGLINGTGQWFGTAAAEGESKLPGYAKYLKGIPGVGSAMYYGAAAALGATSDAASDAFSRGFDESLNFSNEYLADPIRDKMMMYGGSDLRNRIDNNIQDWQRKAIDRAVSQKWMGTRKIYDENTGNIVEIPSVQYPGSYAQEKLVNNTINSVARSDAVSEGVETLGALPLVNKAFGLAFGGMGKLWNAARGLSPVAKASPSAFGAALNGATDGQIIARSARDAHKRSKINQKLDWQEDKIRRGIVPENDYFDDFINGRGYDLHQ